MANSGSNTVSVLLGNGDGTFQSAVSYRVGFFPDSVAVGDFNGDGHLDLAVVGSGSNNGGSPGMLSILLGKGDGTFQVAQTYGDGIWPHFVTVGDFNGDGKEDIVTANFAQVYDGLQNITVENDVVVFLGNGDGTFQAGQSYYAGDHPHSVAVGDFNGDGKLDLAVADIDSSTVSVLLGNGDGTFQAPKLRRGLRSRIRGGGGTLTATASSTSLWPITRMYASCWAMATARSGTPKATPPARVPIPWRWQTLMVMANSISQWPDEHLPYYGNSLSVLLGNGDGSFQPAQSYVAGGVLTRSPWETSTGMATPTWLRPTGRAGSLCS